MRKTLASIFIFLLIPCIPWAGTTVHMVHSGTIKYIAASDSSDADKAAADVVCDGTDDQSDFNTLISNMDSGGIIRVFPGEYNFDTLTVDPQWENHYYGIGFPATQTDTYPSRTWMIEGTNMTMWQQWMDITGHNGAIFNVTSTAMGKLGATDYAHAILQCKGYASSYTTD
jgi:hypothetical protein